MGEELYRLIGPAGPEYGRARQCVRDTLAEAFLLRTQDPDTLAEAILARLVHLDPPMLVTSVVEVADDTGSADGWQVVEPIPGWGVWHAEDEEWIGWGATRVIAAEIVPYPAAAEWLHVKRTLIAINEVPDDWDLVDDETGTDG